MILRVSRNACVLWLWTNVWCLSKLWNDDWQTIRVFNQAKIHLYSDVVGNMVIETNKWPTYDYYITKLMQLADQHVYFLDLGWMSGIIFRKFVELLQTLPLLFANALFQFWWVFYFATQRTWCVDWYLVWDVKQRILYEQMETMPVFGNDFWFQFTEFGQDINMLTQVHIYESSVSTKVALQIENSQVVFIFAASKQYGTTHTYIPSILQVSISLGNVSSWQDLVGLV